MVGILRDHQISKKLRRKQHVEVRYTPDMRKCVVGKRPELNLNTVSLNYHTVGTTSIVVWVVIVWTLWLISCIHGYLIDRLLREIVQVFVMRQRVIVQRGLRLQRECVVVIRRFPLQAVVSSLKAIIIEPRNR